MLKRRNSDDSLAALAAAEEAGQAAAAGGAGMGEEGLARAASGGLPMSRSAPSGSSFDLAAAAEAEGAAAGGGGASTSTSVAKAAQQMPGSASWGLRVTQQLTGRGAAVLSSTGDLVRSTSQVLRRMWPVPVPAAGAATLAGSASGGLDPGTGAPENAVAGSSSAFAGAAAAAAAAAAVGDAPGPMEIDSEEEEELDLEEELEDAAAAAAGAGGAFSFEERRHMRAQLKTRCAPGPDICVADRRWCRFCCHWRRLLLPAAVSHDLEAVTADADGPASHPRAHRHVPLMLPPCCACCACRACPQFQPGQP